MIAPGTRIGPYEITSPIGTGGMGEVYRARDTRLNRDVAVKILPQRFADDPAVVERFEREAHAVAALSHPNILAIHDFGRDGGRTYSVTELLEGSTLRERLADGPLPARKAIDVALQILRGLAAAHERSIVHRDLKPENVFITRDGLVKLLDFGIAKSLQPPPAAAETGIVAEPTRLADTTPGTVLGTVGYMSPEQVRGAPVDQRTDIFSFGAVLFEMTTGTRPFDRASASETLAAVLRDDLPELPAARALNPGLERIIRHCLEKAPGERFQTAKDIAFALEAFSGGTSSDASGSNPAARLSTPVRQSGRPRSGLIAAGLTVAALVAWFTYSQASRPLPDPVVRRASVLLPAGMNFRTNVGPGRRMAVSPDGTRLAYVAAARGQAPVAFIYTFSSGMTVPVVKSEGAGGVSWSADSRTLLFRQGPNLMSVDMSAAGAPIRRADAVGVPVSTAGGGLLSSVVQGDARPLLYLAPGETTWTEVRGGPPSVATNYPTWIPGGRFLVAAGSGEKVHWYAGDLSGAPWRQGPELDLEQDLLNPVVIDGYMITAQNQLLVARPFDTDTLTAASESFVLGGPIDHQRPGSGAYSIAEHVLAYQTAGTDPVTSLIWYDRRGARLSQLSENGAYSNLELSPDGTRLLVGMVDPAVRTADIWTIDLARGVRARITTDPADERSAAWTPDSRGVVYRGANRDLFRRPTGQGSVEPFEADGASKDPFEFSPDGKYFIYRRSGGPTSNDIWIKPADPIGPGRPLLDSTFGETDAAVSPDSRWLAYTSNDTGRQEVYVTSFPDAREKWPVSLDGGSSPAWNPAGGEIFYLSADRVMMRVAVRVAGGAIHFDRPQPLFETDASRGPGAQFIVSPDGQRFLVNTDVPSFETASIAVVFNWRALLRK